MDDNKTAEKLFKIARGSGNNRLIKELMGGATMELEREGWWLLGIDDCLEQYYGPMIDEIKELEEFKPYLMEQKADQLVYRFDNGYGASIIRKPPVSYGTELAVIKYDGDYWKLCYDTGITDDVIGLIRTMDTVVNLLNEIKKL